MKTRQLSRIIGALFITCMVPAAVAAEALDAKADGVVKTQKSHSMIGPMDTLLLYHFPKENAVLQITVGNENTKFPMTPVLHVFSKAASEESIKLWIQNQRNCALMPDAADPEKTHPLTDAKCTVTTSKAAGEDDSRNGKFTKFEIEFEFEVKDIPAVGDIQIKNFSDKANVYVKTQEG